MTRPQIADEIRDQIAMMTREGLRNCPDPLTYCSEPELEGVDVHWGPETPGGFLVKTDQGDFKVTIVVEAV